MNNYDFCVKLINYFLNFSINFFIISPGARNSPLIKAVFSNQKTTHFIHFDERAAAFQALGYAKISKTPAVLIATSGSAGVNYFPAVVEAYYSQLPLILITADRPPEKLDISQDQTINQHELYSKFTYYSRTISLNDNNISLNYHLQIIGKGLQLLFQKRLPIHFNIPFREPLLTNIQTNISSKNSSSTNFVQYSTHQTTLKATTLSHLLQELAKTQKGLVILGRIEIANEAFYQLLYHFLKVLQWPVFADLSSHFRHFNNDFFIHSFEILLSLKSLNPFLTNYFSQSTILHIGDAFVSKRLLQFIENASIKQYFHFLNQENLLKSYNPVLKVTHHFPLNLEVIKQIKDNIETIKDCKSNQTFHHLNQQVKTLTNQFKSSIFTEFQVIKYLTCLPTQTQKDILFVGNSMPIREVNQLPFAFNFSKVFVNRGTNGIDGLLATASGLAIANHYQNNVEKLRNNNILRIIIGDLSLLHDLNSLAIIDNLNNLNILVEIFVINNQEGTIFNYLPIINYFANEEKAKFLFKHKYTFKNIAKMFNLNYFQINNKPELLNTLEILKTKSKQSSLIEVFIKNSKDNITTKKDFLSFLNQNIKGSNLC